MPQRIFLVCLVLICISFSHDLQAQWRKPRLYHLGPDEGISSWTFDITQDSTGYLYFGTVEGLIRYDGNSFQLFAYDPYDSTSIGPGDVWSLLAASDGMIWAGTRLGGLNRFDPHTQRFTRHATPQIDTSDYDSVKSLYEDEEHKIWVGGYHFMLSCYDPVTNSFEAFTPDWAGPLKSHSTGSIVEIFQDQEKKDLLWIGMVDHTPEYIGRDAIGLVSFDRRLKKFTAYPCWGQPRFQDNEGRLWLASIGLNRFDPASTHCDSFPIILHGRHQNPEMIVRDMVRYKQELILAGGQNILTFSPDHRYDMLMQDESKGVVEDVFVDNEQNVWFGRDRGVTILNGREEKISFYSLREHGMNERIYPGKLAYEPLSNTMYIRDQAGRTGRQNVVAVPIDRSATSMAFEGKELITALVVDQDNNLWISTPDAFITMNPEGSVMTTHVYQPDCVDPIPRFWNLIRNPEGWIGGVSDDQFMWFHPKKKLCHLLQQKELPLAPGRESSAHLQGLFLTNHNTALIFSNEIYEVNLETEHVERLLMEEGVNPFPLTEINSVIEDRQGQIWVASLAMTAVFAHQKDSLKLIRKYTAEDGLGCAWAHELYSDAKGRIWAFASNGINAIDPETNEIKQFGVREGLVDPYIDPRQILTLRDGSLATVNGSGIIVFHPDSLWNAYSFYHIPVVIKEIRIEGKRIPFDGDVNFIREVVLRPRQEYIDVRFQALAYPTDYNVTYSYKVEGLRDDWISIGDNKIVTLAALRPGDYVLHIKSGAPTSLAPEKLLHIHVMTPWFRQLWFITLSGLFFLGLAYWMYRRRILRIRQVEEDKASIARQMAELELKALRSQMNPHFMFNSLNSIKNYILHAEPKLAAEYLSNFSHLIRLILQNSKEKVIPLKEEIETLMLYVDLEQIRFDHRFEFQCTVDEELNLDQIMIPPMLIQPYVENAIWHGLMHKHEKGHLFLRFFPVADCVVCQIEDDGVGRAKAAELKSLSANKYKSMGMGIIRDRIEIMNKMDALGITTEVVDKQDDAGSPAGTTVIVKIPRSI